MNNVKQFEVGKKYRGNYGTYTIAKRTNLFVTLSDGQRYKVGADFFSDCESISFKRNVNYYGATFKETEYVIASNEVES